MRLHFVLETKSSRFAPRIEGRNNANGTESSSGFYGTARVSIGFCRVRCALLRLSGYCTHGDLFDQR